MTEISSGANFTASSRLLQEMHKRAKDGTIDAADVTELNRVATDDTSGMTDDEKAMIASLHSGEGGTTAEIAARNVAALNSLPGKTPATPAPAVEPVPASPTDTAADVQTITEHQTSANEVDFSKLKLVTSEKSALSRFSFGLLGGSNEVQHGMSISDSSAPVVKNPENSMSMENRAALERKNYTRVLAPLENELRINSPDLRQRFADIVSQENGGAAVTPDDPRVKAKIDGLLAKIDQFKNDPQKGGWTASSDLAKLMSSYAERPAGPENTRMTSGYLATIQGSYFNISDSYRLSDAEQKNILAGSITTPANVDDINLHLNAGSDQGRASLNQLVTDSRSFTNQLMALKDSSKPEDKAAYEALLNGMDPSAIDLLQAQTSDLEAYLKTGKPLNQAQMSQANMILGATMRLKDSLKFPAEPNNQVRIDLQAQIDAAKAVINNPDLPPEMKAASEANLPLLEQQLAALPAPVAQPANEAVNQIKTSLNQLDKSSVDAYYRSEATATTRSATLAELNYARENIETILKTTNVSGEARTRLTNQLDATKKAISQISQNQPVDLPEPEKAALQEVLNGLQQLRPPAPPAPPAPSNPTVTTTFPTIGNTVLGASTGMNLTLPEIGVNAGTCGVGDLNLNFDYSSWFMGPSMGGFGGTGGYFSSVNPSPVRPTTPDSTMPAPATTATATRPSFNDILLTNAGADPKSVGKSDQLQGEQNKALAIIKDIESSTTKSYVTEEHVANLKKIIQDPSHPQFQLAATTLDTYKQLIDKGVSPDKAESVFVLAEQATYETGNNQRQLIEAIRNLPNAGTRQEIENGLAELSREAAGKVTERRQEKMSDLNDSQMVSDLLGKLTTEQASQSTPQTPQASQILQLVQHPNQAAVQKELDVIQQGIQTKGSALVRMAANVPELRGKNITNMAQLDAALATIATTAGRASGTPESEELKALRSQFDTLKAEQTELAKVNLMRTDFTTRTAQFDTVANDVNQPPATREAFRIAAAQMRAQGFLDNDVQLGLQTNRLTQQVTTIGTAGAQVRAENQELWDHDISALIQPFRTAGSSDGTLADTVINPALAKRDVVVRRLRSGEYGDLSGPGMARILSALHVRPTRPDGSAIDGSKPGDANLLADALENWNPVGDMVAGVTQNLRVAGFYQGHKAGDNLDHSSPSGSSTPGGRVPSPGPGPTPGTGPGSTDDDVGAQALALVTGFTGQPVQTVIANNPGAAAAFAQAKTEGDEVSRLFTMSYDDRQDDAEAIYQRNATTRNAFDALSTHEQLFNQAMDVIEGGGPGIFTLDPNTGYPTADTPSSSRPELDAKTQQAIAEADRLEAELDLAPLPSVSSNDIFDEFMSGVVNSVRGSNRDILKLIAAQLARQMVEQVIANFYKHKREEAAKHHEDALDSMSASRNQAVQQQQQNVTVQNAGNTQAVAAVSGQAEAAAVGEAYGRQITAQADRLPSADNIHQEVRNMLQAARTGNPPMTISPAMEEQLMDGLTRIMQATETPEMDDDLAALNVFQDRIATLN